MVRTRLVWFTVGFTVTAAAVSQFAWRDLVAHRLALSSRVTEEFGALEARVSKLDSIPSPSSDPAAPELYGKRYLGYCNIKIDEGEENAGFIGDRSSVCS